MDLNAVAMFVKVVEAGSFVAAARSAGTTKSTVARRVDQLEESLGVRLLQRSTRKSQLTDAGRTFYERCRQIVADLDDAVASVTAQQVEPRGKLRFSTSVLLGELVMREWCAEFMQQHPQVELEMFLAARKVDLIAEGFDLVIRVGSPEPTSHVMRRLAPAPNYVCASPAYLEEHGTPTTIDQLRDHQGLIFSAERAAIPWVFEGEDGATASVQVPGLFLANSYPVLLEACLAGLGVAQFPALVCCDALRSGRLVQLLPESTTSRRWLHALYPSRRHLSAAVRAFLDFMSDKLTPAPWAL